MILDRFVPEFAFRERHSVSIRARREKVFEILYQLTPAQVPIVGLLMNIRSLPALSLKQTWRQTADAPFLQQYRTLGFVLLGEHTGEEIALGLIGQFWKPGGDICSEMRTPEDFRRFDAPGYVKAGWNFSAEETPEGCVLRTETRIQPTSRSAALKFGAYWLFVRPGSGIIRRAMLRATKKLAEKGS